MLGEKGLTFLAFRLYLLLVKQQDSILMTQMIGRALRGERVGGSAEANVVYSSMTGNV